MKNEHSVFKKLTVHTLPIAIIPFLLVLASLFCYICFNLRAEHERTLEDRLDSYLNDIDVCKNEAILKTDYIVKNSEITDLIQSQPEELMDRLLLIKEIENYVTIINSSSTVTLTIYTENPALLKSRFTDSIDNLPNKDDVLNELKQKDYLYFDANVYTDSESSKNYLVLYRKLIADSEIVIAAKAYLPEYDNISLAEDSSTYRSSPYVYEDVAPGTLAVTEIDRSVLEGEYYKYGFIFLLIAMLFCALMLFASNAVISKTTDSISSFISSLAKKDIFEVDTLKKIDTKESIELKIIKDALNKLISKVNESKDAQYEAEFTKKQFELDLLQSKINPHILYNSLASLSHRAFKNGDREMFDMIKNLTGYYRLVLAKGKEFTTLSQELDMIKKFIAVNEISHSQKYNYTEEVEPKLGEKKFLHLSLQPFVENSIVHGLSGRKQECEISLKAFSKDNNMIIKIRDNGYGIKEEKLRELKDLSAMEESYGIRNTYDRLCLYYNNKCQIDFDSKFGEYTEVTLTIPQ